MTHQRRENFYAFLLIFIFVAVMVILAVTVVK